MPHFDHLIGMAALYGACDMLGPSNRAVKCSNIYPINNTISLSQR
jgi:hypothetical protein